MQKKIILIIALMVFYAIGKTQTMKPYEFIFEAESKIEMKELTFKVDDCQKTGFDSLYIDTVKNVFYFKGTTNSSLPPLTIFYKGKKMVILTCINCVVHKFSFHEGVYSMTVGVFKPETGYFESMMAKFEKDPRGEYICKIPKLLKFAYSSKK